MSAVLGAEIVFQQYLPRGTVPVLLADGQALPQIQGKDGLSILNDRPLNAETPAHLLNDDITPGRYLFVRNNGIPP